jgi:type VI secretion system protein VasJ
LLLKCATYLRGKDPQDALAYRLPRLARWAEIDAAPPEQRGRIGLKGPGRELADALRGLARTQSWPALLEAVEDAFWQHPLWLDLQQLAGQALNGRGFQAAALGVRDDLRSLLSRAPTLLDLSFSDGTALADAETRSWIEAEVRAGGAGGAASRPAGPALDVEGFEAIQKEARGLAARGDVPGALARMQQALPGDASPRARFLLRLDLASLCADVGRDRLALGIVAELDEQMKRHELETWEPELCIRALQLAYRCHQRALPEDAEAQSRALVDSVYQRLCRLNPMVAAALG